MMPAGLRTLDHRSLVRLGLLLAVTSLPMGTGMATADDDPTPGPQLHVVRYTVTSDRPFRNAEIYYRAVDPPTFADYSHDPYAFSPNVEADLGPARSWTMDAVLADPSDWAMVTVSALDSPQRPEFHCVLAVDGEVVATDQGAKGALCSLRHW